MYSHMVKKNGIEVEKHHLCPTTGLPIYVFLLPSSTSYPPVVSALIFLYFTVHIILLSILVW